MSRYNKEIIEFLKNYLILRLVSSYTILPAKTFLTENRAVPKKWGTTAPLKASIK